MEFNMQKLFISLFIMCSFLVPAKASAADNARIFIKEFVEKGLTIVNKKSTKYDEKRKDLSEFVGKHLDIEKIASLVFNPLGYRQLSPEDKIQVQNYIEKYLLDFFAGESKLSAMLDATLKDEIKVEVDGSYYKVTTTFIKDGKSTAIVWVTDGKKIIYVIIADINQIMVLRSEMKTLVGEPLQMDRVKDYLAAG